MHQNDSEPADVMQENAKLGNRECRSIGSWGYPASDPIVFTRKRWAATSSSQFSENKKAQKIFFYIFCCLFKYFFYVLDVIANCLRLCGSKFSGRRPNFGRRFFIIKSDTEKIIFFMAPEPGKIFFWPRDPETKTYIFLCGLTFVFWMSLPKGFVFGRSCFCLWKVLVLSLEGPALSLLKGFVFGRSCFVASKRFLSLEGPVLSLQSPV